eukprot:7645-Heterococcus_DN1.PRE.2
MQIQPSTSTCNNVISTGSSTASSWHQAHSSAIAQPQLTATATSHSRQPKYQKHGILFTKLPQLASLQLKSTKTTTSAIHMHCPARTQTHAQAFNSHLQFVALVEHDPDALSASPAVN